MPSAIILAGGLGTRLRSAVPDLPKPMAPISGRPFLEYQLNYWISQGVSRFVLSVGYRHEAIVQHFGPRYKGVEIEYAVEERPLGTGGGFLAAAEKVGRREPFLLLNGDTYFEADWNILQTYALEHDAHWCLSLFRTSEKGRYMGIEVSSEGRITSLKSGIEQGSRLANGGVYWVPEHVEHDGLAIGRQVEGDPRALAGGEGVRAGGFEGERVGGIRVGAGGPGSLLGGK